MKRIFLLAILFIAVIEFTLDRARFDLWMLTAAALTLVWNIVGPTLRSRGASHHNQRVSTSRK